jgi:hypothetical protein
MSDKVAWQVCLSRYKAQVLLQELEEPVLNVNILLALSKLSEKHKILVSFFLLDTLNINITKIVNTFLQTYSLLFE